MSSKPKIFVSHVHEHAELALTLKRLVQDLLLDGVDFFVSSDRASIQAGQTWLQEIRNALLEAKLVLVLCNEQSLPRSWINFESGAGWIRDGVPVIPLCFGGITRATLPPPLSSLHALSLSSYDDFKQLLATISQIAGLREPTVDRATVMAAIKNAIKQLREKDSSAHSLEQLGQQFVEVSKYFASSNTPQNRADLIKKVMNLTRPLIELQNRLNYWGDEAKEWINDFHERISLYSQVFVTDVVTRSSVVTPPFHWYLRKQYQARMERATIEDGKRVLQLSEPVLKAVQRSNWRPSEDAWGPPRLREQRAKDDLEIVRILIRNREAVNASERDALYVLDFDHKAYGIPLLVIDESCLTSSEVRDFALGISRSDGRVDRAYEFLPEKGEVAGRPRKRGDELRQTFLKLLAHERLTTVSEYLGEVMIYDPLEGEKFVQSYNDLRQPSEQVLTIIESKGAFSGDKVGLDIGCGTGNYTFPFSPKLRHVHGLDLDRGMIASARRRAAKESAYANVTFVEGNALQTPFEAANFDVVWSVSSLHYIGAYRLASLYAEIARILKPGGVAVLDVGEFLEQHPSLWIAEYFPSLRLRYQNALLSSQEHERLLRQAGFVQIEILNQDYGPAEKDIILRAGQLEPTRFLEDEFVNAIPAFRDMPTRERRAGQDQLKRDMENGTLERRIAEARSRASMPGDLGFVVARRG